MKVEGLVQLIKTVEKTFQTIPTESLSEILRQEGHLQCKHLLKEISTRLKNLTERRSLVVVAGMYLFNLTTDLAILDCLFVRLI